MPARTSLVPAERIERYILLVRGHKTMLNADLAELYGVATKTLVQAVKRNLERLPSDFFVMRAFVALRGVLASHSQMRSKLLELERKYDQRSR